MSRDNSDSALWGILVGSAVAGFVIWQMIKGIAGFFHAAPEVTGYLLANAVIVAIFAGGAVFIGLLKMRTAFLLWLTLVFAFSHSFLSSIANGGMSPDDPMLLHFETTWYSSWVTYIIGLALLIAATVWSWLDDQDRHY
jgi:hypothetical protein